MHSNEERRRAGGGLSTEDLAQPPGSPAEGDAPVQGGPVQEGRGGPVQEGRGSRAPVFPGESTGEAAPGQTAGQPTPEATGERPATTGSETTDTTGEETPRLLTADEEQDFRDRWQEVQGRFVDDPREAVHTADTLVADVMQTLAATFARHKQELEGQWSQGERVDTEDLRKALRRYRSFFNRLLSN
ncbi:hypothetical protein ACH4UM_32255 [Streptomyces sp. NPDC020801]|uniref:hypothetical protein n=1 Tax=unclassified Streptomyces TaxID=2593676 RepID=UPI00379A7D94